MSVIMMEELEYKITQLKKELIQIAEETGLNSHETIYCSQKLDQYITIYQKLTCKNKKNKRNMGTVLAFH
ncbi:aspartyl-phosphate phosphatase Spo0E family protein [Niallia oryzisoli]|uniref:Aspartyl-phosphate phosphatase Spo0E family protein n=1 Tax=Niallia oryzisoli TaxID=1737571 RepID=A0ABZ2CK54_9BACI